MERVAMDFTLTAEQTMLQDTIMRYLREEYAFDKRRRLIASSSSSAGIWNELAALGLLGAGLPEEQGGLGGGPVETMVVMEAMGQFLVTEPYLETAVIGAGLLRRTGGDRAEKLLEAMVAGEARFALAAAEPTSRYALEDVATQATKNGDGWVINGEKSVVDGAPVATHIIVTARTAGNRRDTTGISLFLVDRDAAGLSSHDYRLIDGRSAADLRFDNVQLPADALLGEEGTSLPLVEQVRDEAIAALCSEAVGGMRRMLQDTIDYTRQRRQFGQALSSFQVLQHRMVDMYMAVERAVSATYLATLKLDADPVTRACAASAAKATIAETGRYVGQNAVQLHGGMGMTDELAVGHYFKRATVMESQFGSRDFHVARYAALTRPAAA